MTGRVPSSGPHCGSWAPATDWADTSRHDDVAERPAAPAMRATASIFMTGWQRLISRRRSASHSAKASVGKTGSRR
jgi:hypothetical protein